MNELEADLDILTKDYVWLRKQCSLYKSLYASRHERIDLMNRVGPVFFAQVQQSLVSTIISGIFRIAGSPKSGRGKGERRNLVLKTLLDTEQHPKWTGSNCYGHSLEELSFALQPIKEMRDKQIAHRDADVAREVTDLDSPNFSEIEIAISAMGDALQIAHGCINNCTFVFDPIGPVETELFALDMARIGFEIKQLEDDREYESAKEGNYEYQRCYSKTPDWLHKG